MSVADAFIAVFLIVFIFRSCTEDETPYQFRLRCENAKGVAQIGIFERTCFSANAVVKLPPPIQADKK